MEDFKEKIDEMESKHVLGYLDSAVAEFNLNRHICSKPSKHCQPSQRREFSMSEHMVHSKLSFIFNGMAAKLFGMTLDNDFRFMSPNDMKQFYNKNQMWNNNPMSIMENVMLNEFKNEKEMEVIVYRWTSKMAFCNYSERVAIALEDVRTNEEIVIEKHGLVLIKAIEIQKVLNNELPMVTEKDISLSTRRVLHRTRYDWKTILEVAKELMEEELKKDTVVVDDEERETLE